MILFALANYSNTFHHQGIQHFVDVFEINDPPANEFGKPGDISRYGDQYYVRYLQGWMLADMGHDDNGRPTQDHPILGSSRRMDVSTMNWRALSSWVCAREAMGGGSNSRESIKRKGLLSETSRAPKKGKCDKTVPEEPSTCE
jgi:hypothetical protein